MNPKFAYWLAHEQARNQTLTELALVGMGLMLAFELLVYLPPTWGRRLHNIYLVSGLMLWAITIINAYLIIGGR